MSTRLPRPCQLGLPFTYSQRYEAADFIAAASNHAALTWLDDPAAWPGQRLAVHGEPGTGKTHLLHLFAFRRNALLLDGPALRRLQDLPGTGAIAIDDADAMADQPALLHLLNMAGEAGRPVLLAGQAAPAFWGTTLADLTSRLRAMQAVRLENPDDALLAALLRRLLADRQMAVPPAVQDFLLLRLPRAGGALRAAVRRLDSMSLAAGGRVTRAMAASVLAALGCEAADAVAPPDPMEDFGLFGHTTVPVARQQKD
jgi:chromosomal replication initiation ATPase DnaA